MTDEELQARIAQIEAYIAQEEAAGWSWSGRSVYRALGGSHQIVNDYMKARAALHGSPRPGQRPRTPPSAAAVRQAMAERERLVRSWCSPVRVPCPQGGPSPA